MRTGIASAAAIALCLFLSAQAEADTVTPQAARLGSTMQAVLGASSPRSSDGMSYGCYAIQPPAGSMVVVTLSPSGFAGQLQLARGALCPIASPLAISRPTASSARTSLRFKAAGGRYIVMALGPASGGRFSLSFAEAAPDVAGADEQPQAAEVAARPAAPIQMAEASPPSSGRRLMMDQQVAAREAELARIAEENRRAEEERRRRDEEARIEAERQARIEELEEQERAAARANQPNMGAAIIGGFMQGWNESSQRFQAMQDYTNSVQNQIMDIQRQAEADRQRRQREEAQRREAEQARQREQQAAAERQMRENAARIAEENARVRAARQAAELQRMQNMANGGRPAGVQQGQQGANPIVTPKQTLPGIVVAQQAPARPAIQGQTLQSGRIVPSECPHGVVVRCQTDAQKQEAERQRRQQLAQAEAQRRQQAQAPQQAPRQTSIIGNSPSMPSPPRPVPQRQMTSAPQVLTFRSDTGWGPDMTSSESCAGDLCVRLETRKSFGEQGMFDITGVFRTTSGRRWCGSIRISTTSAGTTHNAFSFTGSRSYSEPRTSTGVREIYVTVREQGC